VFKDVTEGINELIIAQRLTSHAISALTKYAQVLALGREAAIRRLKRFSLSGL
jgi:hypothetical protein